MRRALIALAAIAACVAMAVETAGARTRRIGILPPQHPAYSLAVGRYLPTGCSGIHDFSVRCMNESVGMINAGRRSEGLGPLLLPSNWTRLTVARQLFLLTNLERTARGLNPEAGLVPSLSTLAEAGAAAGRDPEGGSDANALWAGGEPNSIVVVADWIYEDGLFRDGTSENLNCSASDPAGCWTHRDVLLQYGHSTCGSHCAVGAAFSPGGYRSGEIAVGTESYAEILGRDGAAQAPSFTWASELPALPSCERHGDTCPWTGSPILAGNGLRLVRRVRRER